MLLAVDRGWTTPRRSRAPTGLYAVAPVLFRVHRKSDFTDKPVYRRAQVLVGVDSFPGGHGDLDQNHTSLIAPVKTLPNTRVVAQFEICVPQARRHAELAKHLAWSGYAFWLQM